MQAGRWPDDAALNFLVAASFARLGLGTLAQEVVAGLGPGVQSHPDVAALRQGVASLPGEGVSLAQRLAVARENLKVLGARGIDLSPHLGAWQARAEGQEVFAAFDSNLVRRQRGVTGGEGCGPLLDALGTARAVVASEGRLRGAYTPPVYLEGADPPWLFVEVARATARRANGFCGRIVLLQADPVEFIDGMSCVDLSEFLGDERVDVLVGPDATVRLAELQRSRLGEKLDGLCLRLPGTRTPAAPALGDVVRESLRSQEVEARRLISETASIYAGRDASWWGDRFAGAGAGRPLRVLIPSCRCTTFVRHSGSDLAAAFRRAGHEAELLIEPADHAQFSTVDYLRAFERFRPDLVVLVNYPRAMMGVATPPGVPFVCWIQDAMPHLFDAKIGAAQGPLDFVVGHVFAELFQKYGYPVEGAMPAAVVADTGKFHPGPVEAGLAARVECELAFVSHHSETPQAMHERLSRELARDPRVRAVMDRIFPLLSGVVDDPLGTTPTARIQQVVDRAVGDVLTDPIPGTPDLLQRHYAVPLADRILRHQTVAWAARLAQEKGWRLHLYGRGWEKHPTLACYARGELSHGEELRAAYAGARLHLHTSLCSMVHQRVLECALSGGLCLGRLTSEALTAIRPRVSLELLRSEPDLRDDARGLMGYLAERHAPAREFLGLLAGLGRPAPEPVVWIHESRARGYQRLARILTPDSDPTHLFPNLADLSFATREQFEALATRAVEDDAWRARTAEAIASRVRERSTYDGLVPRLIALVRDRCAARRSAGVAA